ncbi:hypothetical protein HD553DRAFT_348742 [Filobasidium floriforme]|uniref:uncharacterized protein n=1 Tax=Filobasidium floriforme TaxID=5210 RepID=UPI001E8D22A1|nr:uncharacterized protein HD553DRAFT_348742 [Filobasidium floriforme]KAH8088235.1 hypothetical protein HD553DRAFT_348742 [Filobasidium floriforme]
MSSPNPAASKWIPLEASPDVFNQWAAPLGLPQNLGFQDLYSLDPDFLQYTPKPVHAVLLLFPSRGKLAEERKAEEAAGELGWKGREDEEGDGQGQGGVWWIKQTTANACGSIGLLHSLLNLPPSTTTSISPDSPLSTFKLQSLPLSPLARAKLLDETPFFETAHQNSVAAGQSRVPEGVEERETDLHFIAFVKGGHADGSEHIVELDGGREGPLDRGKTTGETFLEDVAKVVQEKYIDRAEGDVNFNLITLGAVGEQ